MNYLELINAVLQELNYKVVSSFSDLVKPDHEKIKTLVNRMNDMLLNLRDWDFLLRVSPGCSRGASQSVLAPAGLQGGSALWLSRSMAECTCL